MHNYLRWLLFFSVSWWVLLLPFRYDVLVVAVDPIHQSVYYLITLITGPIPFHSDSSGMYVLLLVCLLLGALTAFLAVLPFFRKRNALVWTQVVLTYFLILVLWKYGWIKLIKLQFYLPEPNTVYRELGSLSKDIAYWSVIGSSRSYVVFMGVIELVAGLLLVFRRTRFVGLLLALGIFINVVMVNIAFDISVKLFTTTILLMIIGLLLGYRNQLRQLVQLPPLKKEPLPFVRTPAWLKALVLSLFVVETVYPSFVMESMNDDTMERPLHHGAYAIVNSPEWNRLYVHREGYLILENAEGTQLDWKITELSASLWKLHDQRTGQKSFLQWNNQTVVWKQAHTSDTFALQSLPYRNLPLLQDDVHAVSDRFH